MRRTKHSGSEVVARAEVGCEITWSTIRFNVDEFTGFSPRTGTAKLGPVWCAIGSTARLAMIDALVLSIIAGPIVADSIAFRAQEIRKIRRAAHAECEAQGFGVHDGEPYFGEASE